VPKASSIRPVNSIQYRLVAQNDSIASHSKSSVKQAETEGSSCKVRLGSGQVDDGMPLAENSMASQSEYASAGMHIHNHAWTG